MISNKRTISLKLIKEFHCLGDKCPESCCKKWKVDVDLDTYKKWQKLSDSNLKSLLINSTISKINNEITNYEFIKQDNGDCTHLNKNGLCNLQANYSHAILPNICQSYPRNNFKEVSSGFLSCPEIVDLVYKSNTNEIFEYNQNIEILNSDDGYISSQLEKMLFTVMSVNNIPLNIRLYYIASVLSELAIASSTGNITEKYIRKICKNNDKSIIKQLNDIQKKYKNNQLKCNKEVLGGLWQFMFSNFWPIIEDIYANNFNGISYFEDLVNWEHNNNDQSKHYIKLAKNILSAKSKITSDEQIVIDKIMTKYLFISFINKEYPSNPYRGNFIVNFLLGLFPIIQVMLLFYLFKDAGYKLEYKIVVSIINKVEKEIAHSDIMDLVLNKNHQIYHIDKYLTSFIEFV